VSGTLYTERASEPFRNSGHIQRQIEFSNEGNSWTCLHDFLANDPFCGGESVRTYACNLDGFSRFIRMRLTSKSCFFLKRIEFFWKLKNWKIS
jgi:hypothetical protein